MKVVNILYLISTMIIAEGRHVLLLTTILAVYSVHDKARATECSAGHSARKFNTGDQVTATLTGSLNVVDNDLVSKGQSFCSNTRNNRFRQTDGTCNNPRNLGTTSTPLDRVLQPEYEDGINSPRQRGVDGKPLPSARLVSATVHLSTDTFSYHPFILVEWGQFIAHDIIATASPSGTPSCCTPDNACPTFQPDPNCFPIEVPDNDTTFHGRCLNFVRSLAATDENGVQLIPREQINTVTSFHDGSMIYGSTVEVEQQVREPDSYLLRTTDEGFLPESKNTSCIKEDPSDYCQLGGDSRVNQHPALGVVSTIWVREHNRIAKQLHTINPNLSNEQIYQRARRLNIAQLQAITYNNYLPIILGNDAKFWQLTSTSGRSHYDPAINPSLFSGFSTAGFRFGHSTVPSIFYMGSFQQRLRNLFNRPGPVQKHFEGIASGITGASDILINRAEIADRNFVEDLSKFLFLNPKTGQSFDLVSINIQRGRDHGLPPYHKWRSFCGLPPVTGFNDTNAFGTYPNQLAQVYRSVHDIDLYAGMLHEPITTGLVGPTIGCILRIQFFRTKFGDRFFFSNNQTTSRFTDAQLESIRNTSLAKVFCQNTNLSRIPSDVFNIASSINPLVNCEDLKRSDLKFELFAKDPKNDKAETNEN